MLVGKGTKFRRTYDFSNGSR